MDRPVSTSFQSRRRFRQSFWLIFSLIIIAVTFWLFRRQLQTNISISRIQTAKTEIGPIENTLNASGEVIPAFEQLITSPIAASIQEVLLPVGSNLKGGEAILALDKSVTELAYKKLQDELELKQNQIKKLQLSLKGNLFDLEINDSIKALTINRLVAERDNAQRLLEVGGGVQEQLDEAALNLKIARLEKRQLEHNLKIQRQSTETELNEQKIQLRIQGHQLTELEQKLKKADIKANQAGVLTWVNDRVGISVAEGETIARIANLQSFKVEGTISDLYADQLLPGMRTIIQINEERLNGRVTRIRPVVENNIITFDVQLDEPDHPSLRPNMKVEVFLVVSFKDKAIRVANGPTFTGQPNQIIYVLEGDLARRRKVDIGLSNVDYVEILSNVAEGEEVILSNLSTYEHLETIHIKK